MSLNTASFSVEQVVANIQVNSKWKNNQQNIITNIYITTASLFRKTRYNVAAEENVQKLV